MSEKSTTPSHGDYWLARIIEAADNAEKDGAMPWLGPVHRPDYSMGHPGGGLQRLVRDVYDLRYERASAESIAKIKELLA